MEPSELLAHVCQALERLGVRYLITGSTATIFYGEPRFTNDIDIVARLSHADLEEFCRSFPLPEFYVSADAARRAVRDGGQFNILHPGSGLKIDIMIPSSGEYDRLRLSRGKRGRATKDVEVTFASPEDVIIKKLEFYKLGGSDKHLRDITGVLKVQGERIDRTYIGIWAAHLGVEEIWEAVLRRLQGDSQVS